MKRVRGGEGVPGRVAPRTGARIETSSPLRCPWNQRAARVAPRTGARIETTTRVPPCRRAGRVAPRTGARIETATLQALEAGIRTESPPARGRGLKLRISVDQGLTDRCRPPHGGAD